MGLGTDDVFYQRRLKKSNNKIISYLLDGYHGFILKPHLLHELTDVTD